MTPATPAATPVLRPSPAERRAAALAVAEPHDRRIADAALQRLTPADHVAVFGAWCDLQAAGPSP